MKFDNITLIAQLELQHFAKSKIDIIIREVADSFSFVNAAIFQDLPERAEVFQSFCDWFLPQLIVNQYKSKDKIPKWAQGIAADLWFFCFQSLSLQMKDRVFADKDYDLFWREYQHWTEKVELRCKPMDYEKSLYRQHCKATIESPWMNIDDCSKYIGIAVGTIYNLVSNGQIPHVKKSGLKFNRDKIDAWMMRDAFDPDLIERDAQERLRKLV